MANNSDTSSDERAQRIAELKRKMQESAKKAKAEHEAKEAAAEAEAEPATTDAVVPESAPAEESVVAEPINVEPVGEEPVAEEAPVGEVATAIVADAPASNGKAVVAESAVTASVFKSPEEITPEMTARKQMNRREFLTYSFGAALGLATLQVGLVSFFFMYPRFKAGEFGGAFYMGPESAVPPADADPEAVASGKFWWVNIEEEGPHAIFMVCTHLGCLYKWVDETYRFECPCHGSKFTREGLYIEGPAPRSLDEFETNLVDGEYVVDTGAKILGAPASESEAAIEA